MQTKRLIAGDSMSLEQDKNFYCVVDGMVQVFAQDERSKDQRQSLWDDDDMNGYQLLNEVGSGGTLSSLFTILGLFTEDVKISWQDEVNESFSPSSVPNGGDDADVSQLDLGPGRMRRSSLSSAGSTVHPFEVSSPTTSATGHTSPMSPIPDEDEETTATFPPPGNGSLPRRATRLHEGVIARASEDTTLAVIPAEAFRRLTKKYPKATGHIVQGESHGL